MSKAQLAKVVARHPQILGCSIEQNLKPTTDWILGLGLSKAQLAKVVVGFPHILAYSLEQNLKPTANWILGLGLNKAQLAKVVAGHPQILGYSIEQNLKPKRKLLCTYFDLSAVVELVSKCPRVFSHSRQRLACRLHGLSAVNMTAKLPGALTLADSDYMRFVLRLTKPGALEQLVFT